MFDVNLWFQKCAGSVGRDTQAVLLRISRIRPKETLTIEVN